MTVKISVSLPDDVGEWLQAQPNASAAVADAVRARMPDARRARQRAAAQAYAMSVRQQPVEGIDELDAMQVEQLREHDW